METSTSNGAGNCVQNSRPRGAREAPGRAPGASLTQGLGATKEQPAYLAAPAWQLATPTPVVITREAPGVAPGASRRIPARLGIVRCPGPSGRPAWAGHSVPRGGGHPPRELVRVHQR